MYAKVSHFSELSNFLSDPNFSEFFNDLYYLSHTALL